MTVTIQGIILTVCLFASMSWVALHLYGKFMGEPAEMNAASWAIVAFPVGWIFLLVLQLASGFFSPKNMSLEGERLELVYINWFAIGIFAIVPIVGVALIRATILKKKFQK